MDSIAILIQIRPRPPRPSVPDQWLVSRNLGRPIRVNELRPIENLVPVVSGWSDGANHRQGQEQREQHGEGGTHWSHAYACARASHEYNAHSSR